MRGALVHRLVPWIGFPLTRASPETGGTHRQSEKFVAFESYYAIPRPCSLHALAGIKFPYVEGLRLDEAMHPLALLVTFGAYGRNRW